MQLQPGEAPAVPGRDANPTVVYSRAYVCATCQLTLRSNNVLRSVTPEHHMLTGLWHMNGNTALPNLDSVPVLRCNDAAHRGHERCLVPAAELAMHRAWLDGFAAGIRL